MNVVTIIVIIMAYIHSFIILLRLHFFIGKVHFISMNQSAVNAGADEGKFEMAIASIENRDQPFPNPSNISPTKKFNRDYDVSVP